MLRAQPAPKCSTFVESLEPRQLFNNFWPTASLLHPHSAPHVSPAASSVHSIVGQLGTAASINVSTVPSNGDLNPYGTAFVPSGFSSGGPLQPGDLLIANFNDSGNSQGTGSTIDSITPTGQVSTFFQGAPGLGLSTALTVLKNGFVVVGALPTTNGTSATAQAGSLIILNKFGLQVADFTNAAVLNGPWDMTANDQGSSAQLFISNVFSGTVERINLSLNGSTSVSVTGIAEVASGYTFRSDSAALELGPTGLAYNSKNDTLYVASTADNKIYAVPHAGKTNTDQGTGSVLFSNTSDLHGPLGLVLATNGDLIAANGDAINADSGHPSELTEITTGGNFVGQFSIDTNVDAPFGIAQAQIGHKDYFAAVDDNNNTVTIWTIS